MNDTYDIAVIGAGMAGASLAAECAPHASVIVLEGESQPGYHTTGRSAAFWEECYGGPDIVPLTLASGEYLRSRGFLSPRGALYIARKDETGLLDAFERRFEGTLAQFERIDRAALAVRVANILPEWTEAIWQPDCADIDVAGLHAHYLAKLRRAGGAVRCSARLADARRADGRWLLTTATGQEIAASILVDAAGAWADPVAAIAGVEPFGIRPLRRTLVQLRADPGPPADQPLVLAIDGSFYFKPEPGGRIWLSPHDETPSEPVDAAPEEIDVARAIERFGQVIDCRIEAVERKWAGLRSFAPDRLPVIGFEPSQPGFFWFAGQGGWGIQTAPAAARLAAQLLLGRPHDEMTDALNAASFDPARRG